jgi:hypothetical protein
VLRVQIWDYIYTHTHFRTHTLADYSWIFDPRPTPPHHRQSNQWIRKIYKTHKPIRSFFHRYRIDNDDFNKSSLHSHFSRNNILLFYVVKFQKSSLTTHPLFDVYQNHLFLKKIPSVLSRSSATEKNVNLVLIRGQVCFVSLLSRSKSANIQSSSNERRSKGTFYLNHSLSGLIHFYSFDSSKVHFFFGEVSALHRMSSLNKIEILSASTFFHPYYTNSP